MRFRRNSPTAGEELYEQKETNKPEGSCRRGALGRKEPTNLKVLAGAEHRGGKYHFKGALF
jgi:hypothetical protein